MSVVHRSNTAANYKTSLVRQPGGQVTFNKDGSVTATETFRCKYSEALTLCPRSKITHHPEFPALVCEDVTISEVAGEIAEITATFVGLAVNGDPGLIEFDPQENSPLPDPVYELNVWAGETPITEFPNFVSTIGSVANGAKYTDNIFIGWSNASPYFGYDAYVTPRAIWRELSVAVVEPRSTALNQIAKRVTPSGPVPTAGGARDWLLTRFDYVQEGQIYRIVKEWTLSEDTGWNANIYSAG